MARTGQAFEVTGTLFLAALLGAAAPAGGQLPLAPGNSVEDAATPGGARTFAVEAASGVAVRLRVDHAHLDLALRVLGPDGTPLGERENVSGTVEPLTLTVLTRIGGTQRVEVALRSATARGGSFRLGLVSVSAARPEDGLRMEAERLRSEADHHVASQEAARFPRALEAYGAALDRFTTLGDPLEQAITLEHRAQLLEQTNRLREARAAFEQALPLWRAAGDRSGESTTLNGLGLVLTELGDPRAGLDMQQQALSARRAAGPLPYAEGAILNDMAVALGNLGDFPGAIARYTEALALATQDQDEMAQAMVLKNRAGDYKALGEFERALADFRHSRARFEALGNIRAMGSTDYAIGIALGELDRRDEAWRSFESARALLERSGHKRFLAFTLNHMGLMRLDAHRYAEANALFQQALALLEAGGDRRSAAGERMNLARALSESGHPREALEPMAAACRELHAVGDRNSESRCLTHLAQAELSAAMLSEAHRHLLDALRVTEDLRASIQSPSARATYLALRHGRYELLAEVQMALHAREPAAGWDVAALETSESVRARSLLDLLAGARADVHPGVAPELDAQARVLEEKTERARKALVDVLGRKHGPDEADSLERQLESLRVDREGLEARMRASSPRYAALAPPPLSLAEMRRRVLDDRTALLEFLVGDRKSFVWVVTRDGLRSATLPGRAELAKAVEP
ncbi:MAG TPA: tetratricopeptide repeat protein, partial [Myxococcaceae bacterium]|nr:tetratricopeptide repeat protein [Myxococcaceae bacterium]